jgi:hypothetical protein
MPVAGRKQPDPNSQNRDWMYDTANPSRSIAPIQIVSPSEARGSGNGAARRSWIAAASRSSADGVRNADGSWVRWAGSVTTRSRIE